MRHGSKSRPPTLVNYELVLRAQAVRSQQHRACLIHFVIGIRKEKLEWICNWYQFWLLVMKCEQIYFSQQLRHIQILLANLILFLFWYLAHLILNCFYRRFAFTVSLTHVIIRWPLMDGLKEIAMVRLDSFPWLT